LEDEVARWEIKSSEINLGEKIGKGSYGVVYKGKLRYLNNKTQLSAEEKKLL
jgi:hypothetical protein